MADLSKPCTREEALGILRTKVAQGAVDPPLTSAQIAEYVARLQTLPDAELTVLTQSEQTFAIVESNRRFLVALQREAERTTDLTKRLLQVTGVMLVLTGLIAILTLMLIVHH
jgi:hypothetical protein